MNFEDISSASTASTEPCRLPKSRSKISAIDKDRIINAYQEGNDMHLVSQVLNVNYGSLKNIVSTYNKTGKISRGKIGGYKKKIINGEMGEKLLAAIDEKPHMTLKEMKIFLLENGLNAATSTIAAFLKGRFYTYKKMRNSMAEKNSQRVKDNRYDYLFTFLKSKIRSHQCIYIDETYCNFWIQRLRGRSLSGENCFPQVPTQRGKNISI